MKIYGILLLLIVSRCGVPQADYDKLNKEKLELIKEKEKLKSDLDECENGEERLISIVKRSYSNKKFIIAKENINKLYDLHPESSMNAEFKNLLKSIDKEVKIENQKKEAAENDRIRIENLNNTGMWEVLWPGKLSHIRNKELIRGTFSNTATQDSELDVRIFINAYDDISIQLFEYAGNNPVKSNSIVDYDGFIMCNDASIYIKGVNYGDRIYLNKTSSQKLHKLLKGEDVLYVVIIETDRRTNEYGFRIQSALWYENAYLKLKEFKRKKE
jgi:hypothetical protein